MNGGASGDCQRVVRDGDGEHGDEVADGREQLTPHLDVMHGWKMLRGGASGWRDDHQVGTSVDRLSCRGSNVTWVCGRR